MPFLQMRLKAESEVRALRRQIKPYKEINMSTTDDLRPKKSKATKVVEAFSDLSLKEQIQSFEDCRGILEQSLNTEKANLSAQRTDIENILEQIQK